MRSQPQGNASQGAGGRPAPSVHHVGRCIIAAPDIDGDRRSELLLTSTESNTRVVVTVHLVRVTKNSLKLLGSWTGLEHCSVSAPPDEILHRITAAGTSGPFKDTAVARRCYYAPAPPSAPPPRRAAN